MDKGARTSEESAAGRHPDLLRSGRPHGRRRSSSGWSRNMPPTAPADRGHVGTVLNRQTAHGVRRRRLRVRGGVARRARRRRRGISRPAGKKLPAAVITRGRLDDRCSDSAYPSAQEMHRSHALQRRANPLFSPRQTPRVMLDFSLHPGMDHPHQTTSANRPPPRARAHAAVRSA